MTNPSSLVYINAQSQLPNGVNVAAGSLVTIALASIQGVYAWSVECIGTDDLSTAAAINASLTVNSASFTATFTMPNNDGYGAALIFRSVVNNGIDINNLVQPYLSTTFGVYTPVVGGIRVGAQNETVEGNSTYGWLTKFNEAIRSAVTTSVTFSNDLSGTQTFQTVVGLQNRPVVSTAPTSGQALEWNGSAWAPATISGSPTGPAGGDLSGSYPNPTISGLAVSKLAGGTNGYVLETVSGVPTWQPAPITFTAGGDLSGTSSSQEVIGILNQPLPSLADGYLFYNGSSWVFQTLSVPTTLPPSGSAGGALSGFYPNPTISLTSNSSITGTLPAANQANQSITLTGDATSSGGTTSSAATSVVALRGKSLDSSLSSIGSVQDGYVLTWVNGSSDWQAKPTATTVTSLPMSGDVTGTTNANTISNLAVSKLAAGTAGQLLLNNSTPTPTWTTMSGDATITSAGVVKVTGIDGYAVPTPSGSNSFLQYNSGTLSWAVSASGVTWANDLAGSTSSDQYVVALTGPSGGGGTIPVAAQKLSFGSTVSSPTITQSSTTGSGDNLQILGQNSTVSGSGGTVYLKGGTATSGNGGAVSIYGGTGSSQAGTVTLGSNTTYLNVYDGGIAIGAFNIQWSNLSGNGAGIIHNDNSGYLTSSLIAVNTDISPGGANQVLINNATPVPAWTTLSGDVTNSLGVMTVGGIKGHTLPSLPVSDGYLQLFYPFLQLNQLLIEFFVLYTNHLYNE